ncbi:hypothetical protein BT67DRAFT_99681 [Trichocladium antarcticum]|uniref:Uncharacterized protein n=1 Tax=Trichocladium antarcticum TaxID=1450529 RepID=A0AAN6UST0_9PEZI|nr:hypothetical protein BT67DRAFT_99681 [Trichocladium antarcticum]
MSSHPPPPTDVKPSLDIPPRHAKSRPTTEDLPASDAALGKQTIVTGSRTQWMDKLETPAW